MGSTVTTEEILVIHLEAEAGEEVGQTLEVV
jgi:hypothetical protein